MTRESAIEFILDLIEPGDLVIACNGKIGRELFELRVKREELNNDFILYGAMGCALAVAIGVAEHTEKKVICLLGDGNLLMKLGTLATFFNLLPRNLYVYVLNNDAHDSTGGQPTAFKAIREFLPNKYNFRILDVALGARADLGRPTHSAPEITRNFMRKCLLS